MKRIFHFLHEKFPKNLSDGNLCTDNILSCEFHLNELNLEISPEKVHMKKFHLQISCGSFHLILPV